MGSTSRRANSRAVSSMARCSGVREKSKALSLSATGVEEEEERALEVLPAVELDLQAGGGQAVEDGGRLDVPDHQVLDLLEHRQDRRAHGAVEALAEAARLVPPRLGVEPLLFHDRLVQAEQQPQPIDVRRIHDVPFRRSNAGSPMQANHSKSLP